MLQVKYAETIFLIFFFWGEVCFLALKQKSQKRQLKTKTNNKYSATEKAT